MSQAQKRAIFSVRKKIPINTKNRLVSRSLGLEFIGISLSRCIASAAAGCFEPDPWEGSKLAIQPGDREDDFLEVFFCFLLGGGINRRGRMDRWKKDSELVQKPGAGRDETAQEMFRDVRRSNGTCRATLHAYYRVLDCLKFGDES